MTISLKKPGMFGVFSALLRVRWQESSGKEALTLQLNTNRSNRPC